MHLSLRHLFQRLTDNVAPKTSHPAPKARPQVELLEARDQPSLLLYPQMIVAKTGPGGGVIGELFVTHQQANGIFHPTTFQGQFWDDKLAGGHAVGIPVSGGVAFRLFGGDRPAWFNSTSPGSYGLESETVDFTGTFHPVNQRMEGKLTQHYTETFFNLFTHKLTQLHWATTTSVELVPEIPR
jgi:hypothetical protein